MLLPCARAGLELRLLEERHAVEVFTCVERNHRYLREWMPWVDATTAEDDTVAFIRAALERFASKGELTLGLWESGRFCGTIGTHKLDVLNRSAEVGYWIAEAAQGQGLMTDACRALLTYVFAETGLNRIEIRCATGNRKSRAIPERLGCVHEATLRQAQCLRGSYVDLELYRMLRADWRG